MSVEHLDDLRAATRHARERYQLYEAKAYGPRPTSPARLRELQRCYEQADARLRAAEAEAQRTGAAGDASVSGSLRGRSLRTSLNTDAHQRRYFCIASRKRACAASASARLHLVPTLTTTLRGVANVIVTVSTLESAMHSGMFGGPAPDALLALISMLATLRDARGNTTIQGLESDARWQGVSYPPEQFRADAQVLDGVDLLGDGSVEDMLWSRAAVTVLGIDCPPVVGSATAVSAQARARVSLRVPPGIDAQHAQDALIAHLKAATPWHAKVEIEREVEGQPFVARTDGPAYAAMSLALEQAFGRSITTEGQGGSIPLCNVLRHTFPDAEIMLLGVEEPRCLIHAPNESVDPGEIERMALAEALFLSSYRAARRP